MKKFGSDGLVVELDEGGGREGKIHEKDLSFGVQRTLQAKSSGGLGG